MKYVCLSWLLEETRPPSNFQLDMRRLEGLLKRLHQKKVGIVEKVGDDSSEATDHSIHYLPHHAVIRTDKRLKSELFMTLLLETKVFHLMIVYCLVLSLSKTFYIFF